ncbi:MAG: BON domain-containing protein [Planctomycetota bacterium]
MLETSERAEQAATDVLAKSSVRELRALRVDGTSTQLRLTGRVSSFYHKQLAQEAVRPVTQGRQIINSVSVCPK